MIEKADPTGRGACRFGCKHGVLPNNCAAPRVDGTRQVSGSDRAEVLRYTSDCGGLSLLLYDVTTLLCRHRHNGVYADLSVMPMFRVAAQVSGVVAARKVGIFIGCCARRGRRVRDGICRVWCSAAGSGRSRSAGCSFRRAGRRRRIGFVGPSHSAMTATSTPWAKLAHRCGVSQGVEGDVFLGDARTACCRCGEVDREPV